MKTIAFIGTGIMGSCMAKRLLEAGYALRVYEKFREKADGLVKQGAVFCETPADAAKGAQAAISMLGYPQDVEEVYFGGEGLLNAAATGTLLIDMTTSSPALARRIEKEAKAKGMYALDAPVSGGEVGARAGALSIMAGGDPDVFAMAMPLFSIMGKTITLCGVAGMGQNTKMGNQIAVSCNITAVAEAFAYARATGLDPQTMFSCVAGGAGGSWQMTNMSGKMVSGDDKPVFYIRHLIKDMDIALGEAKACGLELPLLAQVRAIYGKLAEQGMDDLGTQAVYHFYD